MEPLRIMLVDDHALIRKGLKALLAGQMGFQVIGEAQDGLEAIELARQLMPDLILMDVHMPRCTGPEATRVITREMPHVKVVMLTISDKDEDLFDAIKSGACGYLLKNLEPEELFEILEQTRKGEAALSGMMMARILEEFQRPGDSLAEQEELTERELEVLQLVVKGDSNAEIASQLFISENTVKMHLRNILDKLHLRNRIQAAVYAIRKGIVSDP
ncbi:MAG: response regulator [Anaerolineae bacterium]|jgi:DNA-binding NarL/FixJ family response regulator